MHSLRYLCLLFLIAPAGGSEAQAPGGGQGPTTVGVIELTRQSVPFELTVPGRAAAYQTAEIRPRVGGVVDEILYDEGSRLEAGDPMFRIDGDTLSAELDAAEARVQRARTALQAAEANLERRLEVETLAASEAQIEEAEVNVLTARATLRTEEAQAELARLNLERTVISTPIPGVGSVATVSIGALLSANQPEALATVTQLDPIYLDIVDASSRVLQIRSRIDSGLIIPQDAIEFRVELADGRDFDRTGTLVAQSSVVDPETGTTDFRVRFDNPDALILPGQFLRVTALLGSQDAFLVPHRAATREPSGLLTLYLARDGVAQTVTVEESGSRESSWIVTEGLSDGDMLIVDGLSRLRAGQDIAPEPVTLTEDGVTQAAEGN